MQNFPLWLAELRKLAIREGGAHEGTVFYFGTYYGAFRSGITPEAYLQIHRNGGMVCLAAEEAAKDD